MLFGHLKAGTLRQIHGVIVTSKAWQEETGCLIRNLKPGQTKERTNETGIYSYFISILTLILVDVYDGIVLH